MKDRTEVAIVVAMEREIAPLVRGWNVILGPQYRCFERDRVLVICAGIGADAAHRAAETVLTFRQPSVVISAGFAGSLRKSLPVGSLVVPTKVLNAEGGQTFRIDGGEGTLVSTARVASPAVKWDLAKTFAADAVDMEAASVAEVAQAKAVRFVAVKAISDAVDFELPAMDRFIDSRGQFQMLRFAVYAALRPAMWSGVAKLKRNAEKASAALCEFLNRIEGAADMDRLVRSAQAS